ncbi:hypothetical protein [Marinicella rhabdoformis]|uniref:hypothetical protein n=1 Tax=Marinicella rhabdoformis TaxID=2580566 RepID=UPI0015CFFDDD|nr:hypothetical protein [Marinicella rhabdoformis]
MKMTPIKAAVLGGLFAASTAQAINVDALFEGQWYRTDIDGGQGWSLDYMKVGPEKGSFFVSGYVYDDNGNPFWVVGQDLDVQAGESTLNFDLLSVTGGSFDGASSRDVASFGTMTMEVNNCRSISVDISGIDSTFVGQSTSNFDLTPFDEITGYARDISACPYQTTFTSCPSFATAAQQPKTCVIQGTLTGDKTLTNDTNWVLNGGVFVGEDGGTTGNLTIEPGTRVLGVSGNDFLAVQRGSKIFAEGTAKAPIVFTGPYNASAPEAGAGNWGGLVISGRAPLNICDDSVPFGQCEAVGEGGSGLYGGDDPTDSSGVIKYVRIQFGGYRINDEDELNGLAVQGAGSGTVLDYIQIHANEDDGIEFYGGTANAKHLVLTSIKDDSLDWTHGWQGNLQYVLVKQDPSASAVKERGIEADNFEGNNEATPRSMPMIANATFIGGPSDDKTTTGMVLRRGTGANFTNTIVTGFEKCLDIDSGATFDAAGTPQALTGTLTMENTTISCDVNFEEEDGDAFTVQSFFEAQPGNMVADPMLMGIYPTADSPAAMMMDAEKWGPFFDKVTYIGAFKNQATAWTNGWTEFLD